MKPVIIKADSTKIDPMIPEAASRKRNRSNLDFFKDNHVDGYETSDESGNSLNSHHTREKFVFRHFHHLTQESKTVLKDPELKKQRQFALKNKEYYTSKTIKYNERKGNADTSDKERFLYVFYSRSSFIIFE